MVLNQNGNTTLSPGGSYTIPDDGSHVFSNQTCLARLEWSGEHKICIIPWTGGVNEVVIGGNFGINVYFTRITNGGPIKITNGTGGTVTCYYSVSNFG